MSHSFAIEKQEPMGPRAEEFSAWCLEASARTRERMRHEADIAYGPERAQRLDVYVPEGVSSGAPVLVNIHGGFWHWGYKEWHGFQAETFSDVPAISVSVEYRLSPPAVHPDALNDCVAAVAWVYQNIARYGGGPSRIYLTGHSAGGHLAALTALSPALLEAAGVPSSAIRGCMPVSGVLDVADAGLPEPRVADFAGSGDRTAMSPMALVSEGAGMQWLVLYGEKDFPVLIPQAKAFAAALRAAGAAVSVIEDPGADHFDVVMRSASRDYAWSQAAMAMLTGAALTRGRQRFWRRRTRCRRQRR